MNKKGALAIMALVMALLTEIMMLSGCANRKNASGIREFRYSFGKQGDKTSFRLYFDGDEQPHYFSESESQGTSNDFVCTEEMFEWLNTVVSQFGVSSWNGFVGYNSAVQNGYEFELYIEFFDETYLKASGYESYPDSYDTIHKVFVDYLEQYSSAGFTE